MQPLYLSRHDLKPPPPAIYPKLQTIHFMVGFGVLATYTGCMQMPNANELPLQVRRFNLRCGQPLKCLVCGITLRHGVHGTVWASTTLLQGGHLNNKHITNSLNCWIGELSQFAMHALYRHAGEHHVIYHRHTSFENSYSFKLVLKKSPHNCYYYRTVLYCVLQTLSTMDWWLIRRNLPCFQVDWWTPVL